MTESTNRTLDGPVPGDPFAILAALDLEGVGYLGEEWFLSGTAASYALDRERNPDGHWNAEGHRIAAHGDSWAVSGIQATVLGYAGRPNDPTRYHHSDRQRSYCCRRGQTLEKSGAPRPTRRRPDYRLRVLLHDAVGVESFETFRKRVQRRFLESTHLRAVP